MPAVLLYPADNPAQHSNFFLGEVEIGEEESTDGTRFVGFNNVDYQLRQIRILTDGPDAQYVQLSLDGQTWVDGSILAAETLEPEQTFSFYARAVSPEEGEDPGTRKLEFVVRSTSIG